MGSINLQIPQVNQPDATEDPKIASDFTAIQDAINGNLDATNITAGLAQSAGVNQGGQPVKGAVNIASSESTSSASYTTLTTPDQVAGLVLPTNGLIAVWYQATCHGTGTAKAAIFVGSNQLKFDLGGTAPAVQEAPLVSSAAVLATNGGGLASDSSSVWGGDVSTGQVVGSSAGGYGPCYIFAAAGTYTVSIRFKSASGSAVASNRKLWVQALSFS